MPKTILVTGSLGYIGSRLTPYLEARRFHCIGYDAGFFRECTLYPPQDPQTLVKDLRHLKPSDLEGVDAVVHLAAISNDPFRHLKPEQIYDPTRKYTLQLAELCKKNRMQFIFASSCSVYGIGGENPVTEESGTFPQTAYSINKLQIESDLSKMSDGDFRPVVLRLATVFGPSPRMRFDLCINMFAGMALTAGQILLNSNGQSWRPAVYIEDVCKAISFAIDHKSPSRYPLILNVGDDRSNFKIIDLARMVQAEVSECGLSFLKEQSGNSGDGLELVRDQNVRDNVDTRTYKVSFHRIKEVFKGFSCDWTVQEGIRTTLKKLGELPLTKERFRNANFYRLQKFSALFDEGFLNGDLSWKSQPEAVGWLP